MAPTWVVSILGLFTFDVDVVGKRELVKMRTRSVSVT
ncbi:hypothetical protein KN1_02080 [Stygiolobus caldivivus]|uniref:Uncharacterized protein n=1 Tax=Stygiolobus caldivivus TaxID=2824673 RepID=A0A8D5ZHQ3_9CREN|nr:hypothetical protein KN1_02080 [Stygiolobus caldivivus]